MHNLYSVLIAHYRQAFIRSMCAGFELAGEVSGKELRINQLLFVITSNVFATF